MKVKGNGRVFVGVCAGGWRFSPWWTPSAEFQEFSARFYITQKSATVALFGADGATEAVIASMELIRLNLPPLTNVEIDGTVWSAADYAGPGVSRGNGNVKARHTNAPLLRLPVPRTSRPLYLTMRSGGSGKVRFESCGKVLGSTVLADGVISWGPFPYSQTNGMISVVLAENLSSPLSIVSGMFSTNPQAKLPTRNPFRGNGVAAVGTSVSAPKLDGTGMDAAWLRSFPLSDFRTLKGTVPAAEKTSLRMLWDEQKLYLLFRGTSYSLLRLSNDFTSFRKNVMQNDNDGIFYDDCFVFVLQDRRGKKIFDFAVNASGALADARMPDGQNPWKKRDLSWNSGAVVKTSIREGEWCAELAIPWKALQIKPEEGMEFGFCAGRYDGKNRESSTWQPTEAGYHNPAEYGTLKLSKMLPEIRNIELPDFQNPSSVWRAGLGKDAALVLEQHGTDFWSEELVKDAAVVPTGMALTPAQYFFSLSDPVTRECLLRIPAFAPAAEMQPISCQPETTAYLNGRTFVKGAGNLFEGLNILAVRIQDGEKPEFKTGGERIAPDATWRYSAEAPADWNAPEFDDSGWTAGSSDGKAGYYRKKLVLRGSVIWPNYQQEKLHINAGMVQMLGLLPNGVPGVATPDGYRMIFEVSKPLEMLGASGCFQFNPCKFERLADKDGFRTYAVTLPRVKSFNTKPVAGHQVLKLFFRAGDEAKGRGVIRFHAETPDRKVVELTQTLDVEFLPKLEPGIMKNLFFQLWMSGENAMNDTELQEKVYRAIFSSGINEIHAPAAADGAVAESWRKRNLPGHYFAVVSMGNWGVMFQDYLKANPQWRAVSGEGRPDPQYCCPQFFKTPAGRELFASEFRKWFERKKHVRHVQWDYEESVWNSRFCCYCPRCLKLFADTFKLEKVPVSRQQIREQQPEEWVTFNCRRFADEAAMMQSLCRENGVKFSVYSGYQSEFSRTNYGVDWRLLAGTIDLAMTGYGAAGRQLEPTLKALGTTPLVNSLIIRPHSTGERTMPTVIPAAKIIQAVADSTGNGTMFYYYPVLDGRMFSEIAEASRLLARHEAYFLARKPVSPWKFTGNVTAYFFGDGKGELGLFLNLSDKAARCSVTRPNGKIEEFSIVPGKAVFLEHH